MIKIENNTKLFSNGKPSVFGYALNGAVDYNIEDAKIKPFSLKEWDFYQITSNEFCMQVTIGHTSYATSISCNAFEFMTGHRVEFSRLYPLKKAKLDRNAEDKETISFKNDEIDLTIKVMANYRNIRLIADDKKLGHIDVDVTLIHGLKQSIEVVTPFEKNNQFYLNHKMCCMPTSGYAHFGDIDYNFNSKANFALLDWGRGVLPYKHEWIWGSASGEINDKLFGFNIGIFGRDDFANENILFYGDKVEKLEKLNFEFDNTNYMGEWHIKSEDGKFDLVMTPVYDNHTKTDFVVLRNECHQVFGKWNGKVVVEGEEIEVKDFFAFCENAHNRW